MVFLKLVHTEYQVNQKTQSFWVKVVHLVPNVQTLAGHAIGAIHLATTTALQKLSILSCIMAFPVVEFSREGYKIRKVFG